LFQAIDEERDKYSISAVFTNSKEERMSKQSYVSARSTRNISFCLLIIGLAGSSALAATCSYLNLNGVFGYVHGRPGALAVVVVGQLTLDGQGNVKSASWTESENGFVTTGTTTGAYTISPSCSGTLTLENEDLGLSHFNIYLNLGNKMFQILQTDSGSNQPGFGQAEGTVTCGVPGKEQFLTTNLVGFVNGVPAETVGAVTLDGKGNISGTETFTTNGVIETLSVTGTYTENSNCTGTWQITPTGGTPTHFNTVIVNSGNDLLLIQTDAGAVTAGNAQTSASL
jgi:hypothetical protein